MQIRMERLAAEWSLVETINQARLGGAEVALWWLGQAGFAVRYGAALLLIDPYLSDALAEKYRNSELKHLRMMPPPVDPAAIRGCDWYLCTHGHTDHMDAQTIAAVLQANAPQFVTPRGEAARAQQRFVPLAQAHLINAGERISLGAGMAVEAVAAAHEEFEHDEFGNHKFLGYILTLGDKRLYHSGDCVPYPGLAEQLAARQIDVALLPINGRDAFRRGRGVPGNFTVEEAIALCRAAGIPHLIGHHWGLFDFNTIDPAEAAAILEREAAGLDWLLPQVGVTYLLTQQ
jgi:L-ascorbate metabolism protein UlaG (beta-lactamase superfamily)